MKLLDCGRGLVHVTTALIGLTTVAHAQDTLFSQDDPIIEAEPQTPARTDAPSAAAIAAEAAREAGPGAAPVAAPTRRAAPTSFVLRDIRFDGPSAYFDQARLEAAEAQFLGRRISLSNIGQIGEGLTQTLYGEAGILTAQAIVTDLDMARGAVTVELLEARLGTVTSQSSPTVSSDYLDFRLQLQAGMMADTRNINDRLLRLFVTDGLAVGAEFAPGASFGTTDLTVRPIETPRRMTLASIDNYGSDAFGEAQARITHTITSLTGWNDPLTLGYTWREGSDGVSLGYSRVIHPGGLRVFSSLAYTESTSLRTPRTETDEYEAAIGLTWPLLVSAERIINLSVGLTTYRERSVFSGVRTLDQSGHEVSLSIAGRFSQTNGSISANAGLTFGEFDDDVFGTERDYALLRLSATYLRSLGDTAFFSATLAAQTSINGPLPSRHAFTITDPGAVRGYPAGLSAGDSGYVLRLQLERAAPFEFGDGTLTRVRPFAFVDVGEAFDSTDVGLGQALSIGIGASFSIGERTFGDIYVAKPLETGIVGWGNRSSGPVLGVSFAVRF